jgi:hypothetical protein
MAISQSIADAANSTYLSTQQDWEDWESRGQSRPLRSLRAGLEGLKGSDYKKPPKQL